ncbi:unnamed protein product [Periconia digitata]|uniref:lytic cellulose monooxygenase (C4-dehydrogenating) n=1 Tax=Periconia digitata TaxID=1303443 RepID=A0A9W4URJ5_9PLEO|nr:unnamed protein product [Periconia digitata]
MKYILPTLSLVATAAAHGYVDTATIGGKQYTFYQPYQDPYMNPKVQRVSREIQGNGPVEDVTLADVQCGGYTAGGVSGSKPAALHADAAAGSEVTLNWTLWPDSHVGPLITYMARCPDTGCNDYMPGTAAVWFKIHEEGRSGTSNNWASNAIMKSPSVAKYTIPACLKPGYYLVRHETIALHSAYSYPGAQFYPGCHQLKVSGSGSTTPSSGLVAFPGAYKANDPGVTYDAYKAQTYTIPGPKVFTC